MSLFAHPRARPSRAVFLLATSALALLPMRTSAQELHPHFAAKAAVPAPKTGAVIQHIVVRGTQRVEPSTVLSYMVTRVGEPYDEVQVDRSLKALFATGLFADVKINWDAPTATLTVNVVENPIVNQVQFEGNDAVSTKDLTKEVQLKPRMVFTRNKVQDDVQRIIELYRRNGKFSASVNPEIIERPQNRVDLIFSIHEGPTTGVSRIVFIGNKVYSDATLRSHIATEQSAWYKILATNDNYDPDRLIFDREQLRRFYLDHGYADFSVKTSVAQLTPNRKDFYIRFAIHEGARYHIGKVEIDSTIKELPARELLPLVRLHQGDLYNASLVDKTIDALTNAVGTKGYAFAQVHPRLRRDRKNHTIDLVFKIDQGPRVYIERINITGNNKTLDKVIRREFRVAEGDAYNRVLVDRSRTRVKSLGFFKNVDISTAPGSAPDRTILNVHVTEQSTGQLQLGAGYSSFSSFVGQFSYLQSDLFGTGESFRASVSESYIQQDYELSFTEPYFLNLPLSAGIDLYKMVYGYTQASYQGDSTSASLRFGFPVSEYGSVGLNYTWGINKITPYPNAPLIIQEASGTEETSAIGYSYAYNTLNDPVRPTHGMAFTLSQQFSGLGGNLKYLRSTAEFLTYYPIIWSDLIGSLKLTAGYITGYGGQFVPLNERFFRGGDSFPGFKLAGVGPRDIVSGSYGAVGGDAYAIGSTRVRLPDFMPASYGISLSLFSYFGTLGHIDSGPGVCTPTSCVKDNMAFRMSVGLSVGWKSPFGPVEIDFGVPIIKAPYDQTQNILFSTQTGLGQQQ